MITIEARNVNEAYHKGMNLIKRLGVPFSSRAGNTLRIDHPVTTVYYEPDERVLFDAKRDCNPFFHLMEALWMLQGRNDVDFLVQFNKNMASFSDDGKTFHGAYGYRWKNAFGFDQIKLAIKKLHDNPNDRQVVVGIWNPILDMFGGSKDIPCNDMIKFDIRNDELQMYVFNRSNDIIWGAYGANAVHFSFLQEYVAAMIGVPMGKYYQISCDYHAYENVFNEKWNDFDKRVYEEPYSIVCPKKLIDDTATFDDNLQMFFNGNDTPSSYSNSFFSTVVIPMKRIWCHWKTGQKQFAAQCVNQIEADDWRLACSQWMNSRLEKKSI